MLRSHRTLVSAALLAAVLASAVSLVGPAAAKEKKTAEEALAEDLARAADLVSTGRHAKAVQLYERLWQVHGVSCRECLTGAFRAAVATGDHAAAVLWAGAALDDPEVGDAFRDEVEGAFRRALDSGGGDDPDVLWGLIDVLARRGKATDVALVAERYLTTDEKRALICAAESRPSFAGTPEELRIGAELNDKLRSIDWPGPFLGAGQVRRPRARNTVYREGPGIRYAGVVDRLGLIDGVRRTRPVAVKVGPMVHDTIHRSLYEPATYQGRRIAACFPFSIRQQEALPEADRRAKPEEEAGDDAKPGAEEPAPEGQPTDDPEGGGPESGGPSA